MRQLMRILLFLISWCLLCVSCIPLRNASGMKIPSPKEVRTPTFGGDMTEAVFHGSMELYEHHFSGIFALKKESEEKYRMVLMSEVGMTLLDFSFTSKDFQVNYCIDPLRKKALLNLLYRDFLLLTVSPKSESLKQGKEQFEQAQFILYKKEKSRDFYYFEKGTMVQIVSKAFLNRTDIQFVEMKEGMADSIKIKHKPVKLRMALKRIN